MSSPTRSTATAPGATPDTGPYTQSAIEQRAQSSGEPAWVTAQRREGLAAFERTPFPTDRDRAWKYYNPTRLRFRALSLTDGSSPAPAISGGGDTPGLVALPLAEALKQHEALVRAHLGEVVAAEDHLFAALNTAFWDQGVFIYVPKETTVSEPVRVTFEQRTDGLAIFPRVLVVLERGARLSLIEERTSAGDLGGFVAGVTEFVVGEGAELSHYAVQTWGSKVQDVTVQRARLAKDARATTLAAGIGGEVMKWWVESRIEGAGSDSNMLGAFFGTGSQHMDVITVQDHIGPHTTSDLLYKSALADRSIGAYYGLTRVGLEARGTAANQEDRNLLLSPKAKADADPVLEILTSDVIRCGHGASAGPVDQEQIFYLRSRGLPAREATKLLVQGFLNAVLERIPLEAVRDTIQEHIEAKLEAAELWQQASA